MATFTDPTAFANHIAGYSERIKRSDQFALKAELEVVTTIVRKHGRQHTLKARGGKKVELGATSEGPYPYAGGHIGYVKAAPMGFWVLLEQGAKAHWIMPRGVTRGRRQRKNARGKQALFAAGYAHPISRPIWHPGTGGAIAHPWEAAMVEARVIGPKVYEETLVKLAFGAAA